MNDYNVYRDGSIEKQNSADLCDEPWVVEGIDLREYPSIYSELENAAELSQLIRDLRSEAFVCGSGRKIATLEKQLAASKKQLADIEEKLFAATRVLDKDNDTSCDRPLAARIEMLITCRDRCRNGDVEQAYTETLAREAMMRKILKQLKHAIIDCRADGAVPNHACLTAIEEALAFTGKKENSNE